MRRISKILYGVSAVCFVLGAAALAACPVWYFSTPLMWLISAVSAVAATKLRGK